MSERETKYYLILTYIMQSKTVSSKLTWADFVYTYPKIKELVTPPTRMQMMISVLQGSENQKTSIVSFLEENDLHFSNTGRGGFAVYKYISGERPPTIKLPNQEPIAYSKTTPTTEAVPPVEVVPPVEEIRDQSSRINYQYMVSDEDEEPYNNQSTERGLAGVALARFRDPSNYSNDFTRMRANIKQNTGDTLTVTVPQYGMPQSARRPQREMDSFDAGSIINNQKKQIEELEKELAISKKNGLIVVQMRIQEEEKVKNLTKQLNDLTQQQQPQQQQPAPESDGFRSANGTPEPEQKPDEAVNNLTLASTKTDVLNDVKDEEKIEIVIEQASVLEANQLNEMRLKQEITTDKHHLTTGRNDKIKLTPYTINLNKILNNIKPKYKHADTVNVSLKLKQPDWKTLRSIDPFLLQY